MQKSLGLICVIFFSFCRILYADNISRFNYGDNTSSPHIVMKSEENNLLLWCGLIVVVFMVIYVFVPLKKIVKKIKKSINKTK
jgi:uncharacterized BrkB/YihY/UPF0761 family membrane protein